MTRAARSPRPPAAVRAVRSFVRREGRLTAGQRRALDALAGRYTLDPAGGPLEPAAVFGRHAPFLLEIGCGAGELLVSLATARPEQDYLGIEVYRPGVGRLLQALARQGCDNVRVLASDAAEVLEQRLRPESLDGVYVFFPDPWPKKRHHKRRLLNRDVLGCIASRLKEHGRLYVATDWSDYAAAVLEAARQVPQLTNLGAGAELAPRPRWRPLTRFERRALDAGRPVIDLVFARAC
ncbi:MAG: tRNA (guanosine(46)-N7)-methyltransferase TrmB [Gammaproteobacteria bacterium]|nr:tRNA (guanosine(46)-N7)-methyltransferase TrmB [Gammaproteobacteria bacterium]